jgi:hypothetical protein
VLVLACDKVDVAYPTEKEKGKKKTPQKLQGMTNDVG